MYEYPCIPLPTCRKHAFFKRHNQMSYSVTAFHSKLGTPGWYTTFSMWSIGKFQQSGELKKHSHFFFLHFQSPSAYKKGENEVVQSCLTLWDLRGFSIHGIFQVRVLEWVAIFFSRGSSWPREWTLVSHTASRHFYSLRHQGSHMKAIGWSKFVRIFSKNQGKWRQLSPSSRKCGVKFSRIVCPREFPGRPVVKTLCFHC